MTFLTAPKAVIFGCQGPDLLPQEAAFFSECQPLGFILFERNCLNRQQVKKLIADLRATVNHSSVPILIDQEGGRVVRLRPPEWRGAWPASLFGQMAQTDLKAAEQCVFWQASLIGQELAELGINLNCAPCADLLIPGADPIIGDRAYAQDWQIASQLSLQTIRGLQSQGITPILKHLPGHGRAPVDSHIALPVLDTPLADLESTDFLAFQTICQAINSDPNNQPWGMTAHVIYQALDALEPATHSCLVIDKMIRHFIGFQGFLISDCLTMKALVGSFAERAMKALQAGCDAVLHCKGDLNEMIEIAQVTPALSAASLRRLQAFDLSPPKPLSLAEQQTFQNHLKYQVDLFLATQS